MYSHVFLVSSIFFIKWTGLLVNLKQLCKLYSNSLNTYFFHLYDLQDLMFNINPRPSLLWNLFKYPAGGIAQSWKVRIYSMQAVTLISIFNLSFLHIVNQLFFATTLFHSSIPSNSFVTTYIRDKA